MIEWVPGTGWILNIDREATADAHEKLPLLWPDGCSCLYCRNFTAAVRLLPQAFAQLCSEAGIDPAKPIEVYECGPGAKGGTRWYGGWYHLVGEIVTRTEDDLAVGWLKVRFTDVLALVHEGFPAPTLQLEFSGDVPWVVDERPEGEKLGL